jgi:hypothetical protein
MLHYCQIGMYYVSLLVPSAFGMRILLAHDLKHKLKDITLFLLREAFSAALLCPYIRTVPSCK